MTENDETNKSGVTALIIGITVLVCCICLLVAGIGGYGYYAYTQVAQAPTTSGGDTISPFETTEPEAPTELFIPTEGPVSNETLETLSQSTVPENDMYELACRLQGKCNIAETLTPPPAPLTVGTVQKFWLMNSDTNQHFQIDAELLYVTPLTYFWAEKGTQVDQGEVKALMDTFDQKIIPTNREFFGSEWTPGVDGDPHIYVLYAGGLGSSIGGYFSSSDEYNPLVHEYSNGHELFLLSSTQPIGDDYAYSTLAHEFVHMIQFPTDRNDVSWLSEGFAELGAFLNGYDVGGADWFYVQNPDLQLNDWATNDSPDFGAHYGQSFLYVAYFLDRFGEEATKALTANPENDLASIDDTLAALDTVDPQTGKALTADDVFMDWAAAMYLKDGSVGDGRYTYHNYPNGPQTSNTETIFDCPQASKLYDVYQYGMDYINIACPGEHTIVFTGSTAVQMLPADPYSGKYTFATNEGNESDMTLTREFDFTKASGDITFSFRTWYDLEKDFDYLYFEVSEDGKTWQIITTPSGTGEDPSGNSYGWGYNGATNGWMQEEIDLSQYAGKKIQVRFEYVTDAAVLGEGFMLDDVSVDAIGYQTDFETDDGGWQAAGFSRVQNILPQTFRLALITKGSDGTTVEMLQPDANQYLEIPLNLQDGESATLIVSGMTRYTRNKAAYQIEIK
ncbi:MAG: immune inhibitor A [Chloroflexi bacterium]|nr:immune inhibitor A [Chloroflexota bacterium]